MEGKKFMNILIVEDDKSQQKSIQAVVCACFSDVSVSTATNYQEAVDHLCTNNYDIFLLDIDLNEGNDRDGIALANYIRGISMYRISPILFLTSYPNKIEEAVNQTHCYSYLIKPYGANALKDALLSLAKTPLLAEQIFEFKDSNGIYYHLRPDAIVYAEVLGHTLHIYTDENQFETKEYSFQQFCRLFPLHMLRCHKSYAVNPQRVLGYSFHKKEIYLPNSFPNIPIGRQYLKSVQERL